MVIDLILQRDKIVQYNSLSKFIISDVNLSLNWNPQKLIIYNMTSFRSHVAYLCNSNTVIEIEKG